MTMNKIENYLHEFLRVLFANRKIIKRVFLVFAVITLLLPLGLKQSFDITAEVIVQSKKLPQTDPGSTGLIADPDRFIPPSLTDMETENNILRSPTLIRQTIEELHNEGLYNPKPSLFERWLSNPLKRFVVNPLRALFGLEVNPVRGTMLDAWAAKAAKSLDVETRAGSNVISIVYHSPDPALGTRFVERLLMNYLESRQVLQSNDQPQSFYEQKKAQYKTRLNDLEGQRQALLASAQASDPKEEIVFRLNAINTEEQALNRYRDRALENQHWLLYLEENLASARKAKLTDYTFPFSFVSTVDNVAVEDREVKRLGEQLTEQVSLYNKAIETYQENSLPVTTLRTQLQHTSAQFLKVVENRIRERDNDLDVLNSVIAQKVMRIEEYKARVRQLQEAQSGLTQLDTEIEALHRAFFTYTQRYEERRSQDLMDAALSNARILSYPYEPTEAAFPKPLQIIPLGLLSGLLLAIALGYVREFFDHRFKHPLQIQQHLGLPVLMVINAQETTKRNPHRHWGWKWFWHWVRQ
jgi:uncharacterized protein involved in exopolysaccharide biosynthesis